MPRTRSATAVRLAIAAAFVLPGVAARAADDPAQLATKAGCAVCHQVDKKVLGPSYKDIAAKYKGQDVTEQLATAVRKGSKGVWGPLPMAPTPPDKISDADLKTVIAWVLKTP